MRLLEDLHRVSEGGLSADGGASIRGDTLDEEEEEVRRWGEISSVL